MSTVFMKDIELHQILEYWKEERFLQPQNTSMSAKYATRPSALEKQCCNTTLNVMFYLPSDTESNNRVSGSVPFAMKF